MALRQVTGESPTEATAAVPAETAFSVFAGQEANGDKADKFSVWLTGPMLLQRKLWTSQMRFANNILSDSVD